MTILTVKISMIAALAAMIWGCNGRGWIASDRGPIVDPFVKYWLDGTGIGGLTSTRTLLTCSRSDCLSSTRYYQRRYYQIEWTSEIRRICSHLLWLALFELLGI